MRGRVSIYIREVGILMLMTARAQMLMAAQNRLAWTAEAVSYTHLDVYKRQILF